MGGAIPVKNIIQQIVGNVVEEILDLLRKDGITSVGKSIQRIQTIVNPAILEIVASVIEQMDQSLVDAVKERRSDRITVKQRDVPRELLTELGVLRYKRTYYQCDTHRLYLTDQLIGIAPYERVSRELCAKLVQYAAEGSMAAASRRAGVQVSRQTVDNRVLALSEVAVAATPCKQTPEELHVFADEDHVSLQNGRNAMVPLVTTASSCSGESGNGQRILKSSKRITKEINHIDLTAARWRRLEHVPIKLMRQELTNLLICVNTILCKASDTVSSILLLLCFAPRNADVIRRDNTSVFRIHSEHCHLPKPMLAPSQRITA